MPLPQTVMHNLGVSSTREYKSLKRQQFKDVRRAIHDFRAGCAYTPCYDKLRILFDLVDEIEQDLSVKDWGR